MASRINTVESASTDSPSETIVLKILPPNGASMTLPAPTAEIIEGETSCVLNALTIPRIDIVKLFLGLEEYEKGKKIENSVSSFFEREGKEDPTKNFGWDYILVDNDKVVNAWCMPGGKIAVYTGLLKITKNTNALSIVMGHEIAHAVAKHSVERASRGCLLYTSDAADE